MGGRIGIVTGGGDCPGLNAVIRAVVRAARDSEIDIVGIVDGFGGLLTPERCRPLTDDDVREILPRGGTIIGTSNRSNPFAWPVRHGGSVELENRSADALRGAASLALDGVIAVGGDGTQAIGYRLHGMGLPVIGVPKTIDNDLAATDLTFGFDTAVNTVVEALDRLRTTAESHHRVMIVETMGRGAGWIALQAGLAGGADVILIPEIPFLIEPVVERVLSRERHGRKFSLIVVAEGAAVRGGEQRFLPATDPLAPARLGGVANWLAVELGALTQKETRATILGHLQRGGTPTAFDRLLGSQFGVAAMDAARRGDWGRLIALRGNKITAVPLQEATERLKLVDPRGPLVATARSLAVCLGDEVAGD